MSDLIGDDIKLDWVRHCCKVSGTVNDVNEPWTAYDKSGNNTGHFFPWQFADRYKNTEITIKGRTDSDRKVTLDDDGILVLRLENLSENKATIALTDQTVILDFTGVTLGTSVD